MKDIAYADTYFLNGQEALKVATNQNKMNQGYWLQCCYYDGEKIESDLPNLIHLPIENLVDNLAMGIYRLPAQLDFTGLNISSQLKYQIVNDFNTNLIYAKRLREDVIEHYRNGLKNSKLDFNEPLRFYLLGHTNTRVMQHVSKNIANTLEEMGYDVLFDQFYGTEENIYKKISEFNPHVTININHQQF